MLLPPRLLLLLLPLLLLSVPLPLLLLLPLPPTSGPLRKRALGLSGVRV